MSIDRKAALLGCADGQWVRTHGMQGLRLNAKIPAGVRLRVEQCNKSNHSTYFREVDHPGIVPLPNASWTRVRVIEGSPSGVLCLLETSKEAAECLTSY